MSEAGTYRRALKSDEQTSKISAEKQLVKERKMRWEAVFLLAAAYSFCQVS